VGSIDLIASIGDAVAAGRSAALATVVRTDRSVPRRVGAAMVVFDDGRTEGSVGGGEMEARVIAEARQALVDGRGRLVHYRLVDPTAGDPGVCGGEADIYVEPYMPTATMLIVGAGHVGRAVCHLARWTGWDPIVWDDRSELLDDIPEAGRVLSGPIATALEAAHLDARSAIVVVTRNVALDLEILPALLNSGAGYIGVMGSARRWSTTRRSLVEAGVDEASLKRVRTPIGVEIGAETPEEIAISILAEVVGGRRGH
jgi:xanthine dehydrogenase accessory factor